MNIEKQAFGNVPDGTAVDLYVLGNAAGLKIKVATYGATLCSVEAPDRQGKVEPVTLYLNTLEDYLAGHPFLGSIAGRYANRIANGRFTLDDRHYQLATNNGPNHLHGGNVGFDKKVWTAESVRGQDSVGVRLTLTSPDGDEGYPGKLDVQVTYTLTEDNQLGMEYVATTDRPTVLNLTNHAYWNLGGPGSQNVLAHELMIDADRYLPVDATSIPLGELRPVRGTPMDFLATSPLKTVGSRIANVEGGYDHCYVLNKTAGQLSLAARLSDPTSGRVMEVLSTQPGVQLYTANFLDHVRKSDGHVYTKQGALCLETQHYPDSPNRPEFPSTVLRPGETFRETTVHKFSTQ
jgi:aldose 1-epimerase